MSLIIRVGSCDFVDRLIVSLENMTLPEVDLNVSLDLTAGEVRPSVRAHLFGSVGIVQNVLTFGLLLQHKVVGDHSRYFYWLITEERW